MKEKPTDKNDALVSGVGTRVHVLSFADIKNTGLSIDVCHVSLVWRNYVSITCFDKSSEFGPRYEFLPFYSTG